MAVDVATFIFKSQPRDVLSAAGHWLTSKQKINFVSFFKIRRDLITRLI